MRADYATLVASNVLSSLECILSEAPRLAINNWQLFYIRKGILESAFMEDDCVNRGEQLRVAVSTAISN